jgi:hypothetical protein
MDFLPELESMANNVVDIDQVDVMAKDDIERWQTLFGYSSSEASNRIIQHRNDITRTRVSDALWELLKAEKVAEGYDREAYEFSLTQRISMRAARAALADNEGRLMFILQLHGPLDTPEKVKAAAQLKETPEVVTGVGESDTAKFVQIDGAGKARLLVWLAQHHPGFHLTIIRLSKAHKELCTHTRAPCLGTDTTLPQYRLDDDETSPSPTQDHYPVWYFFYGTLTLPLTLKQQLVTEEPLTLIPAQVEGGQIRTWSGKYRALCDGPQENKVDGCAFLVISREQEDALRFYETDSYEVVRCRITLRETAVDGLTFRFCGNDKELAR